MIEKFLRFVNAHAEFKPYLDKGLAETILSAEKSVQQSIFETPQTSTSAIWTTSSRQQG
jgi:hypothetical protein